MRPCYLIYDLTERLLGCWFSTEAFTVFTPNRSGENTFSFDLRHVQAFKTMSYSMSLPCNHYQVNLYSSETVIMYRKSAIGLFSLASPSRTINNLQMLNGELSYYYPLHLYRTTLMDHPCHHPIQTAIPETITIPAQV